MTHLELDSSSAGSLNWSGGIIGNQHTTLGGKALGGKELFEHVLGGPS